MPKKMKSLQRKTTICEWCKKTKGFQRFVFETKNNRLLMCSEKCRNSYEACHKNNRCVTCDKAIRKSHILVNNNYFCSNHCAVNYDKNKKRVSKTKTEQIETFQWDSYLLMTKSIAAPSKCFKQSPQVPVNEFKPGMVLEAKDPRNLNALCVAVITGLYGPRIRLRLMFEDGTNDFYRMVDSDEIHPIGYAKSNNLMLQPPVGYMYNYTTLRNLIQRTIRRNVNAPIEAFKTVTYTPTKNLFEIDQKLEAIDPKNQHQIVPATVVEIQEDKIAIRFDGYHRDNFYWVSYLSRDIFPCGWCAKANQRLELPGDFTLKKSISSKTANIDEPPLPVSTKINSRLTANGHLSNNNHSLPSSLSIAPTVPTATNKSSEFVAHLHKECCENEYVFLASLPNSIHDQDPREFCKNILEELVRCSIQLPMLLPRLQTNLKGVSVTIIYMHRLYELRVPIFTSPELNQIVSELNSFLDNVHVAIKSCVPIFVLGDHTDQCKISCKIARKSNTKVIQKRSTRSFVPEEITIPPPSSPSSSTSSNSSTTQTPRSNMAQTRSTTVKKSSSSSSSSLSSAQDENNKVFLSKEIRNWKIDDVIRYIRMHEPQLVKYINVFKEHEIDGDALLLLTTDHALKHMGLKLGPALKISRIAKEFLGKQQNGRS